MENRSSDPGFDDPRDGQEEEQQGAAVQVLWQADFFQITPEGIQQLKEVAGAASL